MTNQKSFMDGGRGFVRVVLVFAALAIAAATPAHADRKAALKHYSAGTKAYNLGHFDQAITSFEKAYDEDPQAILLFNIAQSHRQLGNAERALFFYRRYLEAAPDAKNRAEVEGRMTEMQAKLDRVQPAPVVPGAPSPTPPPVTADAKPRTEPPTVAPTTEPEPVVQEQSPTSSPGRPLRLGAYIAAGVGVAALATGAIFGNMAKSAGDTQSKAAVYDHDADQAGKTKETMQYVFYGVGGAAIATAAVLWVLDMKRQPEQVAIVPVLTAGTTGLAARMAF